MGWGWGKQLAMKTRGELRHRCFRSDRLSKQEKQALGPKLAATPRPRLLSEPLQVTDFPKLVITCNTQVFVQPLETDSMRRASATNTTGQGRLAPTAEGACRHHRDAAATAVGSPVPRSPLCCLLGGHGLSPRPGTHGNTTPHGSRSGKLVPPAPWPVRCRPRFLVLLGNSPQEHWQRGLWRNPETPRRTGK